MLSIVLVPEETFRIKVRASKIKEFRSGCQNSIEKYPVNAINLRDSDNNLPNLLWLPNNPTSAP
jgi:hypothetical protein